MAEIFEIIDRPISTDYIRPFIGKSVIKVITGQRRIGKSYILKKIAREIAEKKGEFKYIQVVLKITESATLEKEFGNLEQIPDNYEKIVVTLDGNFPHTYRGIRVMSLREFLTT